MATCADSWYYEWNYGFTDKFGVSTDFLLSFEYLYIIKTKNIVVYSIDDLNLT